VVVAKTDPESNGGAEDGVGVFIVDLPNPGFRITRELPKMGVTAVPVVDIELDECRVPATHLVGDPIRGFKLTMEGLNVVRPVVAARGLGLAQGALQYAVDYAQERKTFGKPIIEHQAIGFRLAEIATKIEAARWLTYNACVMVDAGTSDVSIAPYLSMAKAYATELAVEAADVALQTLGGNGYLKDYATERYYRDARQLMLVEGTSEIHRWIIQRALADGRLNYR
jgi:alkylation response protein AidB-like acyl-CoA dehydrogenase